MPLRPLTVSIFIFLFVIVGVYMIYVKAQAKHLYYPITHNLKWIGVIDMDSNHGINIQGVIDGHDVLLVTDYSNPIFQQIVQTVQSQQVLLGLRKFEIGDYDSNNDGLISVDDPIFPFLQIVVFNPNQQGFQVRSLASVGIHGIKKNHLTTYGNHTVILSDGTARTLYEINKPGGTAIYKSNGGTTVRPLPEPIP